MNLQDMAWRALALLAAPLPLGGGDGPAVEAIDRAAFLRQHDMVFEELPRGWQEAPHFGNALVGSMLYQVEDTIHLQVFRADVRDHRDDSWGWTAYSRPRLRIGHFELHPVGELTGCSWRMHLWDAELSGTITTDRGEIGIRHLVHAEDMAIVTELTPSAGEQGCRWTWHQAQAQTTRGGCPAEASGLAAYAERYGAHHADALQLYEPNPPGRLEREGEVSVWVQDLLVGGQYATAWSERTEGQARTHVVTIANSYPEATAASTAVADVSRFLTSDRSEWVRAHRDWWHAYYARSHVAIPDEGLESLYWQTIYRLGCTSRAGRSLVDTSGIWFQGGPWPYITTDWNIQSAHWPVYAANRLEQGQELVDRLHQGRDALIRAVRPVEWQEDSAYLALAVAPDMRGARDGDMRYYDLVGNLPWTLHNLWWHYRYSMDETLLRETVHPLLRRAVNLYLHLVEEGEDGRLHLTPTYSPETGTWADCNFDLALLRWGCLTLLEASERLGIDDPLIPRWRQVAEQLVDFPADEHGFRLGRDETSSPGHRHFSNLLMIYPLHLVNIEQDGSRAVLQASYERAHAVTGLPAMVQSHVAPIGAALGRGDKALEGLKRLQADLLPNGLWACAGNPCIESTLGLANIVQTLLIQSWSDPAADEPGPIRVFPAVPSSWEDVEFRDLRAEGAFLVSAERSGGRTRWVRIRSLAGEPCLVRPGIVGAIEPVGARRFQLQEVSPGTYRVDLERGEEVLLRASAGDR
jgi:hypothetical protein